MPTKAPCVLLVGSNAIRSFVHTMALGMAGYRVDCLPDGVDPVEYARVVKPSAVVVDVEEAAPAADLGARLRAHPATRALPIVAVAPAAVDAPSGWIGGSSADWIVERYGAAALVDALAHALGRSGPGLATTEAPSSAALVPLAADALAANAHLLAVNAFRQTREGGNGPGGREIRSLTRLLIALARAARLGLPAARFAAIPAVRELIGAFVAEIRRRSPSPSTAVRAIQALRAEAESFLARLARQSGYSDAAALSLAPSISTSTLTPSSSSSWTTIGGSPGPGRPDPAASDAPVGARNLAKTGCRGPPRRAIIRGDDRGGIA